jgi:hypothetical protein
LAQKPASDANEDVELANFLERERNNFMLRTVSVLSDSVWGKSAPLTSYFSSMERITAAVDVTPPELKRKHHNFLIKGVPDYTGHMNIQGQYSAASLILPSVKSDATPQRPFVVRKKGDTVEVDLNAPSEAWDTYWYESNGDAESPVTFCFDGRCVRIFGSRNQVYDPVTRSLIDVYAWSLRTFE